MECRDLSQPESAFVQVGTLEGSSSNKKITPAFLTSTLFGSKGKFGTDDLQNGAYVFLFSFESNWTSCSPALINRVLCLFVSGYVKGAYGSPMDVKIKTLEEGLYVVKFTTLTPGMRESDRMAYLTVKRVDDGVFILVTATTAARFKKLEPTMKKIAESFEVIPAPKSTLLKSQ
eukprot:scaffold593155_cov47-Attheya_sp.AAC.2